MTPKQNPANPEPEVTADVIPIGDNHRRRIGASLSLIDDVLVQWERYAAGAGVAGALRHLENDLTPDQRRALGQLVAQIRSLLAELQDALELPTAVRTVRSTLPGQCGILWETVADLDPKHLQAWGVTGPAFNDYWEPRRQRLEHLLNEVLATVRPDRT